MTNNNQYQSMHLSKNNSGCGNSSNNTNGNINNTCSSPAGSINEQQKMNRICRDYVQGVCLRNYCRYPHVSSPDMVIFCHDFQNASCPRIKCKFLHYSLEEEDFYRKFGKFPQHPNDFHDITSSTIINQSTASTSSSCNERTIHGNCRHRDCHHISSTIGQQNICQSMNNDEQFINGGGGGGGDGRRNDEQSLKWNNSEHLINYRNNAKQQQLNNGCYPTNHQHQHNLHNNHQLNNYLDDNNTINGGGNVESINNNNNRMKRSQSNEQQSQQSQHRYEPFSKRFRDDTENNNAIISTSTGEIMIMLRRFEEEHNILKRRVELNEIKIAELRASNDYLMSQNAQIRITNAQCTRVVNAAVVTSSQPQPQQTVISAVSIAPVQVQATPIVSMAAPQTQIISSTCAPLALAANTTQGQQIALAQQSMSTLSTTTQPLNAAHASQILGTSQITLTPTLAQAPSMGLTINTSQALAMSNATQPIISYPVMTHSILPH